MFFGGGTPSLMPPETVAALIDRVRVALAGRARSRNHPRGQPEFGRGRALRRRLPRPGSTGCRSACRRSTRRRCGFLGRAHDRDEAIAAIEPRPRHFPALLVRPDLCPPGPERRGLAARARRGAEPRRRASVALSADDRARHRLRHTRAGAARLGRADEDSAAALFEMTQERLAAAGLPAYEISNHARPGAECRHNLAYWRYQDYLGIGPGAHGRLTRGGGKIATRQCRAARELARRDRDAGTGIEETAPIDARDGDRGNADDGAAPRRGRLAARLEALAGRDVETLFGPQPGAADRRRLSDPRWRAPRRDRRRPPAAQRGAGGAGSPYSNYGRAWPGYPRTARRFLPLLVDARPQSGHEPI